MNTRPTTYQFASRTFTIDTNRGTVRILPRRLWGVRIAIVGALVPGTLFHIQSTGHWALTFYGWGIVVVMSAAMFILIASAFSPFARAIELDFQASSVKIYGIYGLTRKRQYSLQNTYFCAGHKTYHFGRSGTHHVKVFLSTSDAQFPILHIGGSFAQTAEKIAYGLERAKAENWAEGLAYLEQSLSNAPSSGLLRLTLITLVGMGLIAWYYLKVR